MEVRLLPSEQESISVAYEKDIIINAIRGSRAIPSDVAKTCGISLKRLAIYIQEDEEIREEWESEIIRARDEVLGHMWSQIEAGNVTAMKLYFDKGMQMVTTAIDEAPSASQIPRTISVVRKSLPPSSR